MEAAVPAPFRVAPIVRPEPDPRHRLGAFGEDAALRVLTAAGLTVIAARARSRAGELDLVAIDGELVVFVEVKTRRSIAQGRPADAVTPAKQARLARAALAFLQHRRWLDRPCRFDVVEVICGPGAGRPEVNHIIDAFRPRR